MVLGQGLLLLFEDRDRSLPAPRRISPFSLKIELQTKNTEIGKLCQRVSKCFQKATNMEVKLLPLGVRRWKRKNVIRSSRLERIQGPGVQETAQTLRKNVPRAQALRGRVF